MMAYSDVNSGGICSDKPLFVIGGWAEAAKRVEKNVNNHAVLFASIGGLWGWE